jgi:anion-transporting  ArsA/GET3 family ATPase
VADVFEHRLVYVTGKGGVGKTTVAAAMGVASARAGRRTVVCEVADQERITAVFGRPRTGFSETEVEERLSAFSVNPEDAKQEWLAHQLRSGRLAGVLNHSRIFQYLAAAAPGLDELVTLGKIWELAQPERRNARDRPYDVTVVDAPATGHGLAMLRAPRTYADIAKVGPIARHAGHISAFVTDPSVTAVVAVALAEEMPVNETIDLQERLAEGVGVPLAAVLVNAVLPERLDGTEAERLVAAREGAGPAARTAMDTALLAHERAQRQRSQIARLRRGVDAPVLTLPFVSTPELTREGLDLLAEKIGRAL